MSSSESDGSGFDPTVITADTLDFGTRVGLLFVGEVACISMLAVIGLLGYMAYSAVRFRRDAQRRWDPSTPFHWYFLSLLIGEILQSLGSIMDIRWAVDAKVTEGPYCITQGLTKNMGNIIVSLSTLAIAVHTFFAIVFRWHPDKPRRLSVVASAFIWTSAILMISISAGTHSRNIKQYWGSTQLWCMITTRYRTQQILLQYIFMWITAFSSIILYVPVALVISNVLVVEGRSVRTWRWGGSDERSSLGGSNSRRGIDARAMQMLLYPLLYVLTVLPIAVTRFQTFYNKPVPTAATIVSDILFSCSGIFNVILYSRTRPLLLPHRDSVLPDQQDVLAMPDREPDIDIQGLGTPRISTSNESGFRSNYDNDKSTNASYDARW